MRISLRPRPSPKEKRTIMASTAAQIRPPKRPQLWAFDRKYNNALLNFFNEKTRWWLAEERRLKIAAAEERRGAAPGWDARLRILNKQATRAGQRADEFKSNELKQEQYLQYLDTVWAGAQEHAEYLERHGINED